MFVGFFINREIIGAVGYPRKDYFIYRDDFEYARRIMRSGYSINKVRTSIIYHNDFRFKKCYQKNIFGCILTIPELSDWRLYYATRNYLLSYSYRELYKYRLIIWFIYYYAFRLLLMNPRQLLILFKGYVHGILGISGKRMSPR